MSQQTPRIEDTASLLFSMVEREVPGNALVSVTVRRAPKDGMLFLEVYVVGDSPTGKKTMRVPSWPRKGFGDGRSEGG